LLFRPSNWWREPFLFVSAILFALMLYCSLCILAPFGRAEADKAGKPRGNLSDLYPRWLGTRELLLYGHDPYSREVTREIQIGYYGRPLDPARSGDPSDEQRFVYPLYVIFFLAPFVYLPFEAVTYVFMNLLAVLCAWSVLLWAEVMELEWAVSTKVAVVLLAFGTLQALQGLARLQLSLLVFAFVTFGVWFITRQRLFLGGLAFAVATIKPQLVLLPLVFLVVWASACRARRAFLFGFTLGMAVLLAAAELVQPGWMLRFLKAVLAYHRYAAGSLLNFILPPIMVWILTFALVASAFVLFSKVRKADSDSPEFQVVLSVALSLTTVVAPIGGGYNHFLLVPALVGLAANRMRFQRGKFIETLIFRSPWIVLVLQWVLALIVIGGDTLHQTGVIGYLYLFAFALPFFVTAAISMTGVKIAYGAPARI
jgi:Glycosyltransferase family 87